MSLEKLYYTLWQRLLQLIYFKLKSALNEEQEIKLNKSDFEKLGNWEKPDYIFNLGIYYVLYLDILYKETNLFLSL